MMWGDNHLCRDLACPVVLLEDYLRACYLPELNPRGNKQRLYQTLRLSIMPAREFWCYAGDLAGKDWWERQGLNPPAASPPDNLQMVLADVFQEDPPREEGVETAGNGVRSQKAPQDLPHLHFPKTAPADSLLVRQAGLLTISHAAMMQPVCAEGSCLLVLHACSSLGETWMVALWLLLSDCPLTLHLGLKIA